MASKKLYAVRKGRVPGIYSTWAEAEQQVKGFAGAQFKGFAEREEAEIWLQGEPAGQTSRIGVAVPRRRAEAVTVGLPTPGELFIYTDGGALNNPGPGGYGVIIVSPEEERELSGGFRHTTNNRMELLAAIVALEAVQTEVASIHLFSDSSYLVNGMSRGWARNWRRNGWIKADKGPVLNRDLWQRLLDLTEGRDIRFVWVKGHAGHSMNERCDKLAVSASSRAEAEQQVDVEYEQTQALRG